MRIWAVLRGVAKACAVSLKNLSGPSHEVFDSLRRRMGSADPELKVFDSVIEPIPVPMVNAFQPIQWPPEVALHNLAVLHNAAAISGEPPVAVASDIPLAVRDFLQTIRIAGRTPAEVVEFAPSTGAVRAFAALNRADRRAALRASHTWRIAV